MIAMKYLKIAALGILDGLASHSTWRDIGLGLLACVVMVLRILVLVTFPFSAPMIAWLIWADDLKRERDIAVLRERLRRGIHQNGPIN